MRTFDHKLITSKLVSLGFNKVDGSRYPVWVYKMVLTCFRTSYGGNVCYCIILNSKMERCFDQDKFLNKIEFLTIKLQNFNYEKRRSNNQG